MTHSRHPHYYCVEDYSVNRDRYGLIQKKPIEALKELYSYRKNEKNK